MSTRLRVLFVCVHNSARSQMAEAFLNHIGKDRFEAESAGLEPTEINPLVIEAMREVSIASHATHLNWPFENPETFTGSYLEKLGKIRGLRDRIKNKVEEFITQHSEGGSQ